ncbi:MAG: ImmA/IrrE family metallo-endopeptidase [Blautia sp.]|nr:ImmA/IrrE family metallo-endopeptidase [Blautia sp.]
MNERKVRRQAISFLKEQGLKRGRVSSASLMEALEKQGLTVVEFNPVVNDPEVDTVITGLGVGEQIKHSPGFLYLSPYYRVVFVSEKLTEEEKTLVLAHEAGHYCLGHGSGGNVVGRDVREEFEAHEFARFLVKEPALCKVRRVVYRHRKKVLLAFLCLALALGGSLAIKDYRDRLLYEGEYYVTAHGRCYHLKNCMTITGREVRRLTKEMAKSGEYEPCSVCQPKG